MAKETKTENKEIATNPNEIKKFELWAVNVEKKKRQNPETFAVETYDVFTKKGDKPLVVTHIEQRHADTLNLQSGNNKTRYYLPE